jgi:enoyl-CoA hydratase
MKHAPYKNLEVVQNGAITTVTLRRPEVRNAINEQLHDEISQVIAALDSDDSCDVIILTGAGDFFCGGGDLAWVLSMNADPVSSSISIRSERKLQHMMLDLEKPIIAKVRGAAIGLGCSLALFCDLVYATPDAVFSDPHVNVGLVAGDGGAVVWPQLIGYARARRYLLTGDPIRGDEAASIGLITAAVPDADLDRVVAEMASRLAAGATHAIRWTKASINAGLKVTASAVVDLAAAFENVSMMTRDNRAACEAFLAKQKPKFTGT